MAKHKIQVMGKKGDEPIVYDTDVKEEVDTAAAEFARLMLEGKYMAFTVNPEGDPRGMQGTQIREFDEKAPRIILVPPMAGG